MKSPLYPNERNFLRDSQCGYFNNKVYVIINLQNNQLKCIQLTRVGFFFSTKYRFAVQLQQVMQTFYQNQVYVEIRMQIVYMVVILQE